MKPKSFSATKTTRGRRHCSMRSSSHAGACPECTTNCLLLHRNLVDPSSSVDSFFKIMLGEDFSEVMFVPFIVTRENKWHKYINKEACLEDVTGEKYPVKISEIDKVVAFKEGWCRFFSEHHLEEGDFLIFHHMRPVKDLHFIVHIYGKSGKQKVFFSRGHDKNLSTMNRNAALLSKTFEADLMSSDRKKSPRPSVVPKLPCSDIHHDSTTRNNTHDDCMDEEMLQLAPAPLDLEPFYRNRDDDEFIKDRTYLYDLSSFENQVNHPAEVEVSISNDKSGTMKRKSSSPDVQPYKKQNVVIEDTIESASQKFTPQMKMKLNGERSSTHVSKIIERRDGFGPADDTPVQRDVSVSKTLSYKPKLDDNKNSDRDGSASNAKDMRQKVSTSSTIASALVNVAPEVKMASNDGEQSSTHVLKMITRRHRYGPADDIPVQREVSKTPSYKAKPNNKNVDGSRPASFSQNMKQNVATGGIIRTVKKELDIGDGLSYHQQLLSVKRKTISPENVKSFSSNGKKDVKIPKTEPVCLENISPSFVGMESSSAEVDDKPYLILQSELPSVLQHREKLRTIYLRGPDRKVLPVTYQRKNGVRVLTSGWQAFKSMYHLHAGYRCRIELEDASKCIYRLEVLSRGNGINLK